MRALVEIMQETFLKYGFLSLENIEKVFISRSGKKPQVEMPATRAVEPLQRCKVCTLM